MSDRDEDGWTDELSGRERVRRVVELLDGPDTVQSIADRADVSRTTAADELERLERDDWVTPTTVDGKQAYDLDPVRLLFDEITDLIDEHAREELEARLADLTEEREALASEFDVETLSELRDDLLDDDLSAAEVRERRNAIATWEALETDLGLVRHALQLYDDVTELSSPTSDSASSPV